MLRNVKRLGLTLVAVIALSAVVASAASAEPFYFYAGETSVSLEGTNDSTEDAFEFMAGVVKCGSTSYTGTFGEEEASSLELTPSYSECTAFGFSGATVEMNGCTYRFTTSEGETATGSMDVVCPEGKQIQIIAKLLGVTKCTVDIPAQTGLSGITYNNLSGSAHEVTTTMNVEKLNYTQTAGTGFGACKETSGENGIHSGNSLVTTKGAVEATGLAIAKPQPLFVLNPANVNFNAGGKGTKRNIVIENKSKTEEPKLDMLITIGEYDHKDKCFNKTLKKEGVAGDKCTEEEECEEAGAVGVFLVLSTAHFAVNKATLGNC